MMLHNNIGFNSTGSEDMSTETTKNRWFGLSHGRLRPPLPTKPPRISAWTLHITCRVPGLHFCR